MSGLGPITNTRTLKGALLETIGQLERARQKPFVVKLLQRCRDYRELVDDWDSVSPPPDEQFETIGEIMQLLGVAMQATNRKGGDKAARDDSVPSIEVTTIEAMGDAFDEEGVEMALAKHQLLKLDLVPASPCAEVLELPLQPWRESSKGVRVKTIREGAHGRNHALVRLDAGSELSGQRHGHDESIYVLDGCIHHAGVTVHAGACLRIDAGSKSGTIKALGETTLLLMDSERRAIKF